MPPGRSQAQRHAGRVSPHTSPAVRPERSAGRKSWRSESPTSGPLSRRSATATEHGQAPAKTPAPDGAKGRQPSTTRPRVVTASAPPAVAAVDWGVTALPVEKIKRAKKARKGNNGERLSGGNRAPRRDLGRVNHPHRWGIQCQRCKATARRVYMAQLKQNQRSAPVKVGRNPLQPGACVDPAPEEIRPAPRAPALRVGSLEGQAERSDPEEKTADALKAAALIMTEEVSVCRQKKRGREEKIMTEHTPKRASLLRFVCQASGAS
eukprot:g2083.t1